MSEIKTLPLPTRLAASGLRSEIVNFAERLVEHNVAAKDAEIEALRAEVRDAYAAADSKAGWEWKKRAEAAESHAERLAEALRLIAMPQRSDGTWNRDREACRQIAAEALRDHDQEGK